MTSRRSLLTPAAAGAVVLTMMSLNQVFVRQRWLFPSLLGIGVAFLVGWAGRRLDVPGALAPALSVLALVTLLGLTFHPGTTFYGIPTGETMRAIGESLREAGVDLRELAAPAEATDPLTLLATGGVFLVAVLVDILVFRLRRPVAAGVPLLALYLIPTSLADKPNAVVFVLAAFGYLGLLVAEGRDRARAWGRRLSGIDRLDELGDVSHVARVGRRIGTAAVGLALALPVAMPSVGDGIFDGTGPFGNGNGPSKIQVIPPIVEIRTQLQQRDETVVFDVQPEDGGDNGYTRLTSLDEFNGREWKLATQEADEDRDVGGDKTIPQPAELERVTWTERTFRVEVGPLRVQWLPVPYAPRRVDVKGDWKYEPETLSVFSARNNSQNAAFTVTSRIPSPTAQQLQESRPEDVPPAIASRYLAIPDRGGLDPIVDDVFEKVTAGKKTPYEKAMALQGYFRDTRVFTYDLYVGAGQAGDPDPLATFLREREGYCEQFAGTMAYMARRAGIPARVAIGFTRGNQHLDTNRWVVTNKDAHAWPELYFAGVGWVRFEPTPGAARAALPEYAIPPSQGGDGSDPVSPTPEPTPTASGSLSLGPEDRRPDEEDLGNDAGARGGGGFTGRTRTALLSLLGVLALLSVPSLVAWAARRRRRRLAVDAAGRTHAAWATLGDAALDAGYPLRSSDSPRGSARRLVTAAGLPEQVAAEVERLATAEERARYARTAPAVDGLEASARTVRHALLATLPRWRRLVATVLPASSLRRMRSWVDAATGAVERSREVVRAWLARGVRAVLRRRPAVGRAG